jgi:hypothetical protein
VVLRGGGEGGGGVWGGYEDPLFVVRGRKATSD